MSTLTTDVDDELVDETRARFLERIAAAQRRVDEMREATKLAVAARDELVVEARDVRGFKVRDLERRAGIPHSTIISIVARH